MNNRRKALSGHANPEDTERIETFLDRLKLDEPVPVDEFRKVVRTLLAARGQFVYFVWKVLMEQGLDADALVREACFQWGVFNGKKMGEIRTPAEFLEKHSTSAGTLAWDQEYTILNDQCASKEFYACPHVTAFLNAGASKKEIARLCKDMMCHGDYGTAAPHPVKIEWAEPTIGEGGKRCVMIVTPIGEKKM